MIESGIVSAEVFRTEVAGNQNKNDKHGGLSQNAAKGEICSVFKNPLPRFRVSEH